MNSLNNINIDGKRVLIRVDFNVPISDGKVINNFRIIQALPTIKYCISKGCSVVLMSHLGRPKGVVNQEYSLLPLKTELESLLGSDILFSKDCISNESIQTSHNMSSGQIHLLENLRFHKGETGNDPEFSSILAKHGEIYINDAFGTAHRAHASNNGVAHHFKMISSGFLLEKERKYLETAIESPDHPFVCVLGGSKVSGKIELISHLMTYTDDFIIGGAMAYTFLKAKGINVGGSLIDEENIFIAKQILEKARKNRVNLYLPVDSVVTTDISGGKSWRISDFDDITDDEIGVDIAPGSTAFFCDIINKSKTILWNGPMGIFETASFSVGTHTIATAISSRTTLGATTIIGGGDTAAAVESFYLMEGFTHVSTGGGASLELLSGKYLPAFKILDENE